MVAGTVATDTAIRVKITAVGEETALAGIQRLVADAQASSSRAQALADRAAAFLFYFAAGAGLITFVVWTLLGQLDQAVTRTVTVLVIACPHALGLAIPLVIAISTERAARAGILIKDRLALELMRTVDVVLFDKTGTLTKGEPAVVSVATTDGHDGDSSDGVGRDTLVGPGSGGRDPRRASDRAGDRSSSTRAWRSPNCPECRVAHRTRRPGDSGRPHRFGWRPRSAERTRRLTSRTRWVGRWRPGARRVRRCST